MTYKRIPVGTKVRHRDAPAQSAKVGTLIKRLKPCVGAPYMVRVEWPPAPGRAGDAIPPTHSAPINERNLVRVDA